MKRKINIIVILLVLTSIVAMQSCKKQAPIVPVAYVAAMPAAPTPANALIIPFTGSGQAVNLSWAGTASSAASWTVYFGTSSSPAQAATNVTTNSYTANIGTKGGVYYWYVETTDAQGVYTVSPVWHFDVNSSPLATVGAVPALNATAVSCTPTIKWKKAIDPEGDALTYDLYLGTSATAPASYGSGITDTTYAVTTALTGFTDYYWKVVAKDPYGGSSVSPIYKFTTGALPISTFVGNYSVAEPAEGWSYPISFTMNSTTSITTTTYWASTGWNAVFNIDLTALTYSMPLTTFPSGYSGIESGIINKTTGKMTGTYTIWSGTAIAEQGTHTYTHL
jgi:hypothetical protein